MIIFTKKIQLFNTDNCNYATHLPETGIQKIKIHSYSKFKKYTFIFLQSLLSIIAFF